MQSKREPVVSACRLLLILVASGPILVEFSVAADNHAPIMLLQEPGVHDPGAAGGARTGFAIMRMPDGSFAFFDRLNPTKRPLSLPDRDGLQHVLQPSIPSDIAASRVVLDSGVLSNQQVILTPEHEVHSVFVEAEVIPPEQIGEVGLPRYLNVWTRQASVRSAGERRLVWRGYNGSQMEYERLRNGRLLVPYGSFQPHGKTTPPHGRHQTIIQYSDDSGKTWTESQSRLVSPCFTGFNGNNEGACEPAIEQLKDGRIWMLMRTQAGFLYESFSEDNGTTWSAAAPSRFNTSTGPPNIMRHRNGWLVVAWNNCEMPPRHEGDGVYGGRDALHIAVSADEGRTWRGFREIYLDHRRNDNPASSGDRGTAYPLGAYTQDGTIVMLAGQGAGGRNPILIDPAWIVQTSAKSDFSNGLADWSVYKHHGPAKRWWRAREVGCELVDHPGSAGTRCLHVRRPDELPPDGATWNFPVGWKGVLRTRVMLLSEGAGGLVCLNDRMFDPANDAGEEFSIFRCPIRIGQKLGNVVLAADTWYELAFEWDLSRSRCELRVNGQPAVDLELRHPTLNGVSYVRFRSTARQKMSRGFLVERVDVELTDPYAPEQTAAEQQRQQQRYIDEIASQWAREI